MNEQNIKIAIIEDDETIREGYKYLIGNVDGYEIVGTFHNIEESLKNLQQIFPKVILLDIELPGINGIDAIPKIKNLLPNVLIIILTVYEDSEKIFRALTNGAVGYLTKNTSPSKIIDAIREANEGGGPLSPNVARLVINSFQKNQNSPLTKRETEILEQIANGKSRGRIAEEFFIDLETVKTHIKNIYFKLNVHSRADAIKAAKDNRLI
jgi:DNA-binding NarL/FixJ family response regulator